MPTTIGILTFISMVDTIKSRMVTCESSLKGCYNIKESQEVSSFPAGDHMAARNRQDNMAKTNTNNKKYPQKKHRCIDC